MTPSVLLAAALALTPAWYRVPPETPEARAARVALIVESAVAESRGVAGWPGTDDELARAVLATTYEESRRWAIEVHDGRVRGDSGRSCGLGQLWRRCQDVGTSEASTRRHLRAVAEALAFHARRCRIRRIDEQSVHRVFSGYGDGRSCVPRRWAASRARLWSRLARPPPPA